jgi:hypothetical protein
MAREEDDGRAPGRGPQGVLDQKAVLPSEPHIQHEAGRAGGAWAPQKLAGGREGFHLHLERAQEAGQCLPHGAIIVDHKDGGDGRIVHPFCC